MSDPRVSKARVEFSADTSKLDAALSGVQGKLSKLNTITGTSFGLLGVGMSIDALVQLGGQAIEAGNALTAMQASVRAVAGSQEQYDRIVQVATANQRLFGGSLTDNLGTMQQFSFIANRTGADLGELNDVAQLLALVNPFEGFEGAGFALSELFSGDITSIVERFNLSRTAVRGLLDESSSASEIVAGLTALLAEQGITAEVLAAKTNTVAQEYQTFGTNVSNAFTAMGQGLAETGAPLVTFVNDLVQALTDLSPVVSAYVAGLEGVDPVTIAIGLNSEIAAKSLDNLNQSALAGADSYESYASAFDRSVSTMGSAAASGEAAQKKLTEAQYTYAQSLLLTGSSTEQAIFLASQFGEELTATSEFTTQMTERSTALQEAQMLLAQAQARAAITASEQAAAQAASMNIINTSTLATNALKGALDDATKAMFAAANANLSLDEQAQQAAIALLGAGEAGRLAALQLASSTSDIDKLIARYYNLAVAAQSARDASVVAGMELGLIGPSGPIVVPPRAPTTVVTGGGGGGTSTDTARDRADELQRIAERHQERMIRAEETYQQRLLRITEDYAKRRRQANQDYSDQQFGDRVDFYRSLLGIEDEAIKRQASAEYEALALQATQIRDTLGADVAAAFLEEAGKIAAARAKRADEIRKAQKDNSGNLDYLMALDKMEREIEDRRLQRAATGEGSLTNEEEQQKQDAALQLQQDIKQATDDAGKALVDAQGKASTAVGTTNEALQKQLDLLGKLGGGVTTPAGGEAPATTVTGIAGPAAAAASGIAVYDSAVVLALAGVKEAVAAVERAIGRIPTRSVVGGG